MGQNSQNIAYTLGQLGSAYSDVANVIVPPKGMVINAIQFLDDNTPTILLSEGLDEQGPDCFQITTTDNQDLDNETNDFNANGIITIDITDSPLSKTVTLATASSKVKVGQFVLLINNTAESDGDPAITIDAETPTPIYRGLRQQGVKVASVSGTTVVLEGHGRTDFNGVSPANQSLIFIDEMHGAGGIRANGQVYPKGLTIYGRWTAFQPSAAGVICYFGY